MVQLGELRHLAGACSSTRTLDVFDPALASQGGVLSATHNFALCLATLCKHVPPKLLRTMISRFGIHSELHTQRCSIRAFRCRSRQAVHSTFVLQPCHRWVPRTCPGGLSTWAWQHHLVTFTKLEPVTLLRCFASTRNGQTDICFVALDLKLVTLEMRLIHISMRLRSHQRCIFLCGLIRSFWTDAPARTCVWDQTCFARWNRRYEFHAF